MGREIDIDRKRKEKKDTRHAGSASFRSRSYAGTNYRLETTPGLQNAVNPSMKSFTRDDLLLVLPSFRRQAALRHAITKYCRDLSRLRSLGRSVSAITVLDVEVER